MITLNLAKTEKGQRKEEEKPPTPGLEKKIPPTPGFLSM